MENATMATEQPPQEQIKPENPKIKLVYVGVCMTTDDKRGGKFLPITDEQMKEGLLPATLPEEKVFAWKVASQCGRPGTIYQFESPPDKVGQSIFPDTRRYCGRLENDDRVLKWQAEHDAFLMWQELESREKKGKATNEIHEQLQPIRAIYRSLPGRQKTVFLAQIVAFVTGAGGKD
jgi:hypothetical protein